MLHNEAATGRPLLGSANEKENAGDLKNICHKASLVSSKVRATFKVEPLDDVAEVDAPLPWEGDDENDPLGILSSDLDDLAIEKSVNVQVKPGAGFDDLLSDEDELTDLSSLSACPSSPLSDCSYYSQLGEPEVRRKRKYTRRVPKLVKQEVELFKEYTEIDAPAIDSYPLKTYLDAGIYFSLAPNETMAEAANKNAGDLSTVGGESDDEFSMGRKRLRNAENLVHKIRKKIGKLLPNPVNLGEWYLNQQVDFSLPYDIIFEYDNRLINSNRQPPYYEKIKTSMHSALLFFL